MLTFESHVDVEVEYTYEPASRGHRDSFGAPEEPDEGENLELESVTLGEGVQVEISDLDCETVERLEEEAWNHVHAWQQRGGSP